jgi:hypothetical protein
MDVVRALYAFMMTFPTVRVIVTALVSLHHSSIGQYLESWAVRKLNDVLPDGSPAESLVNEVYEEIKSL